MSRNAQTNSYPYFMKNYLSLTSSSFIHCAVTLLFTSTGLYTKCYKRNREARRQPRKQRHCPRNESRKNPDTSQISKKFNTLNEKWIYKIRDTTWEMNLEKGRDTAWEVVCSNVVSQDLHCLHLYLVNNLGLPRGEPWNT